MKIRYTALAVAAAAAMLTVASDNVFAQASQPVSVQVGVGTAPSSTTGDAISSGSIHAGVALALTDTTTLFALPGSEGIDADYNYGSGHGGHFSAAGATYTNRISLIPKVAQPLTAKVVPYVGFGIGVFSDQVSTKKTATKSADVIRPALTSATTTDSTTTTNLGGKLLVGVDTPTGLFVEASYIVSGSSQGVRTDSVNLAVGMHL